MIYLSPTTLQTVNSYILGSKWIRKSHVRNALLGIRTPANDLMRAGIEFGDFVNSDSVPVEPNLVDETDLWSADDKCLSVRSELGGFHKWQAEVKGRLVFSDLDASPVVVSGRGDDLCGLTTCEYKLTGYPDPVSYYESIQWKCYSAIFRSTLVVYILGHRSKKKPPFKIKSVDVLRLPADPERCLNEVRDMAREALYHGKAMGIIDRMRNRYSKKRRSN